MLPERLCVFKQIKIPKFQFLKYLCNTKSQSTFATQVLDSFHFVCLHQELRFTLSTHSNFPSTQNLLRIHFERKFQFSQNHHLGRFSPYFNTTSVCLSNWISFPIPPLDTPTPSLISLLCWISPSQKVGEIGESGRRHYPIFAPLCIL